MTMHDRIHIFNELMGNAFSPDDVALLGENLSALGFFTAPASTKYHGDHEGGLFEHSYKVTTTLLDLTEKLGLQWDDPRSPYLVGMFHDLCKCDSYIKSEQGYEWNKDQVLIGHGDKSVILAQQLIAHTVDGFQYLTDEEILCIRWHMGSFDDKSNWNAYTCAIANENNVLFTHMADMKTTHILGY